MAFVNDTNMSALLQHGDIAVTQRTFVLEEIEQKS